MHHRLFNIKRLRLAASGCLMLLLFSCTKNFEQINTDKTKLSTVGSMELAALFSSSQYNGCTWYNTDNYSRAKSTIADHYSGYTACGATPYDNNQLNTGWINTLFDKMYTGGYAPLQSIFDNTRGGSNLGAYSVALIWKVWLLHQVADYFGPIPYTQAGNGDTVVQYESVHDVYYDMLRDLTMAVDTLANIEKATPGSNVFGSGDLIYSGAVTNWIKFGNTLRLRLAMRISNIDPQKAQAEAEAAAAGPLMETTADDALLRTSGLSGGGNGICRMQGFYQNVMSASMESVLTGYQDPRMQEYFSPVSAANITSGFPGALQTYAGGYHGLSNGFDPSYASFFRAFSNFGPRFVNGNQLVTPIDILHSSEAWFLRAEGAWKGWNMGSGSAQSCYENGIAASINQWRGSAISQDSIQGYINSMRTPAPHTDYFYSDGPMTTIPIKFSTDPQQQYEQILTQKWIALFPESQEAWAEYRRTRLPKIYSKKYSINANVNLSRGMIVTRLPYPNDEKSGQPAQVNKAIQLLGGPDLETTPLWWDTHPNK